MAKGPKTILDQIQLLKSRNMAFRKEVEAPHFLLHITILDYTPSNYQWRKVFPILSAIIYMNNCISPGHHIKSELFELFERFPQVPLYKMGFPKNWKQQPIWQNEDDSKITSI
ncbi:hypothetical protein [Echinicola shivajiensis]|uniref:hypothetical protein n=1 Tax=Echinicola shivajiensis TaxID=1035916 RepID=UPI001BFC36ED|nr:hypothetical protein [Echinicola shivajiensis]